MTYAVFSYHVPLCHTAGSSDSFAIEAEVDDIADKWYRFGKALYLKPNKLNSFKATQKDPKDCLSDSLLEFLKKNYDWEKYGVPSWKLVVIALAHKSGGDDTALALHVANNHSTIGKMAFPFVQYIYFNNNFLTDSPTLATSPSATSGEGLTSSTAQSGNTSNAGNSYLFAAINNVQLAV